MPVRLSKATVAAIHDSLDSLFDKLKVILIGPQSVDKRVHIGVIHDYTLPALFAAAAREEGAVPDLTSIISVLGVADSYIEAYRDLAKAKVVKEVQSFLTDAQNKGIKTDVQTVLGGRLSEVWTDVSNSVHQMIDAEANTVKNLGIVEGISRANAEAGIDDPVVFFVVFRDEHLCGECKSLHLMGDGHTPRLWYMSEVGSGYHKKGDENPKFAGLHPHCRCTLANMPPNYGFDSAGMIEYKRQGYDAMQVQRHLERMEAMGPLMDLKKWTPLGLPFFENFIKARANNNHKNMTLNYPHFDSDAAEVAKHIATSPLSIQFPKKNLMYFEDDPRFKNLGAVGTGRGSTSFESRKYHEGEAFGFKYEQPWTERPVYGAVFLNHHVLHQSVGWNILTPAAGYGEILGVLRPHVNDRATVTPCDSFGVGGTDVFLHGYGHEESLAKLLRQKYPDKFNGIMRATKGRPYDAGYIEAQIHGGLHFNEFQELHIGPNFVNPVDTWDDRELYAYVGAKAEVDRLDKMSAHDKEHYYGSRWADAEKRTRDKLAVYSPEKIAELNNRQSRMNMSVEGLISLCKTHGVKLSRHDGVSSTVLYDPASDAGSDWSYYPSPVGEEKGDVIPPISSQEEEEPFVPAQREEEAPIAVAKKLRKPRTKGTGPAVKRPAAPKKISPKKVVKSEGTEAELDVEVRRQRASYTCGPTSLGGALRSFGIQHGDLSRELGTTEESGTTPDALAEVARKYGLKAEVKTDLNIDDLRAIVEAGDVAIVDYQAWSEGTPPPPSKQWVDGHYSILVGVDDENVYLRDPSTDGGGNGLIPIKEFESRWHDKEDGGPKTYHLAVVLSGDKPVGKLDSDFSGFEHIRR